MTIEKLQKEMITAMKAGDRVRKEILSGVIANIKKAAIDKRCKDNIPESLVDEVLIKEKKTVQEMIDTCPASRGDKLSEYNAMMLILDDYVPKMITDPTEIKKLILDTLNGEYELVKSNRGVIMKVVIPVLKGKVDMKLANQIVGEILR